MEVASDDEILYEAPIDASYWRTDACCCTAWGLFLLVPCVAPCLHAYYKRCVTDLVHECVGTELYAVRYRAVVTRRHLKVNSGICNLEEKVIPLDRITDLKMCARKLGQFADRIVNSHFEVFAVFVAALIAAMITACLRYNFAYLIRQQLSCLSLFCQSSSVLLNSYCLFDSRRSLLRHK